MRKLSKNIIVCCIFIIFGSLLTGCKSNVKTEKKELIIMTEEFARKNVEIAVAFYEEKHPDVTIKIETPPAAPAEDRSAYLQQWTTKIIAGKGPDIYLLSAPSEYKSTNEEVLIEDVTKAIQNGAFAPLDSYMKKDEFWEKRTYKKEILEAGQYQGKQYILPISCNFEVLCGTEQGNFVSEKNLYEVCKKSNPYTLASASRWIQPAVDYSDRKIYFDKEQWKVFATEYLDRFLNDSFKEEESYLYDINQVDMAMYDGKEIYGVLPDLNGRKLAAIDWYVGIGMSSEYKEEAYELLMLFFNETCEEEKGTEFGSTKDSLFVGGIPVLEEDMYFPENPQILSCYHELEGAFFPTGVEQFIYDEVGNIISAQDEWTTAEIEEVCTKLSKSIEEKYFMMIEE